MGADQQAWDYGVKHTRERSRLLPPIPPATTHKLNYDQSSDRWRCKCGYTLGDGRDKFLARCPAAAASNHNREEPNPLQKLGNPKTNDETISAGHRLPHQLECNGVIECADRGALNTPGKKGKADDVAIQVANYAMKPKRGSRTLLLQRTETENEVLGSGVIDVSKFKVNAEFAG